MTLLAELKRCQKCLSADIVQCGIYWKCAQCGEHFPHPLIRAPREMTLAAIQRRFDYGSWDSADLRFLYWNLAQQVAHHTVNGCNLRPGDLLATACSDMKIRLWDTSRSRLVLPPLEGHNFRGMWLQFSRAGDRLFSGDWGNSRRVWDVRTGQETLTLEGNTDYVWSAAFSPDGKRLASACHDGKVKVWDARPLDAEPAKPGPTTR